MMYLRSRWIMLWLLLGWATIGRGEIKVLVEHRTPEQTSSSFRLGSISPARKADAGSQATFSLVEGQRDLNGGDLEQLKDGRLPREEDQPRANFFFRAGTDGGRILVDLGNSKELKQINTYSWHPGTRAPQVYSLYASTGSTDNFIQAPKRGQDPLKSGWFLIERVDTRGAGHDPGGQYGVSIQNPAGTLGAWRYLLFEIHQTETNDAFGNTFYSEIDLVGLDDAQEIPTAEVPAQVCEDVLQTGDYTVTIDTTETPDLTAWVRAEVAPMAREWYPKLVRLLPSEGFAAPRQVRISFSQDMRGVAATGGTRIRCAAVWFRQNLQGEALGAVFHELVHVVQQYGRARPLAREGARAPGWLVEGIADYIRWFQFQPEARGAEITSRNLSRARYDGNYRITANFLNWTSQTYDRELVRQLNAAIREGKYTQNLWKERTGRSLQELGDEWRAAMEKKVAAETTPPAP